MMWLCACVCIKFRFHLGHPYCTRLCLCLRFVLGSLLKTRLLGNKTEEISYRDVVFGDVII